jgi:glycosyltransferase involved in cell wall biosynthesis
MTRPLESRAVTVVIPCFNQAHFLPAAVASVRRQTHGHVECIVVNDGSTDETAGVAATLGVRLIDQSNRGLSEARNVGLAAARTPFVVFLDADDELLPGAAAVEADVLAADASAAAVVGRCQVIDASGDVLPAARIELDPSNLYEEWLCRNFVWTPGAAMFRRSALEELGGFPAGLGPAADYAVYLRLARTGRIRWIDAELVRYRQHGSNMSRDPALMLRATLTALDRERRESPSSLRRARRSWCEWYGEQIVHRLRIDWNAGRRGTPQLRAAAVLVRRCPAVVLRHVARKTRLVIESWWHRVATAFVHLRSRWKGIGAP